MDHVIAARAQMGTSLAFHIVFAALGVGLPLLVFIAEGMWLRTKRRAFPLDQLGKPVSKAEREEILGFGQDGA